jgi:hypothetical protein
MITASTLMRCKALGLADALLEKTCSTTSIAMDWLHNLQRQQLHLCQLQHLRRLRRQLQHQLRHLHLRKHQHLPLHLVQLQLMAIANK